MKTQNEIIDFILNQHSQIIIEGHYCVRSIFTSGTGNNLEEAFNNWYVNYLKNIKNKDWNLIHYGVVTNPNIPQF